jgi:hypothetical protein
MPFRALTVIINRESSYDDTIAAIHEFVHRLFVHHIPALRKPFSYENAFETGIPMLLNSLQIRFPEKTYADIFALFDGHLGYKGGLVHLLLTDLLLPHTFLKSFLMRHSDFESMRSTIAATEIHDLFIDKRGCRDFNCTLFYLLYHCGYPMDNVDYYGDTALASFNTSYAMYDGTPDVPYDVTEALGTTSSILKGQFLQPIERLAKKVASKSIVA